MQLRVARPARRWPPHADPPAARTGRDPVLIAVRRAVGPRTHRTGRSAYRQSRGRLSSRPSRFGRERPRTLRGLPRRYSAWPPEWGTLRARARSAAPWPSNTLADMSEPMSGTIGNALRVRKEGCGALRRIRAESDSTFSEWPAQSHCDFPFTRRHRFVRCRFRYGRLPLRRCGQRVASPAPAPAPAPTAGLPCAERDRRPSARLPVRRRTPPRRQVLHCRLPGALTRRPPARPAPRTRRSQPSCGLLLYFAAVRLESGPLSCSKNSSDLGGAMGIRTPDLLHAMQGHTEPATCANAA